MSENANPVQETAPVKSKFGITEETKSKNVVPFKVTKEHPINAGTLTKVVFEEIPKKDDTKTYGLVFYFTDETKEKNHREVEWLLDEADAKFPAKLTAFQGRMKHIFEEFAPFPKGGIGTTATTMEEFFRALEVAFNTMGKDKTPIFANVPVYIKLTWYKGNLKFPYSPNFIERIRFNADKSRKETNLVINPKFDVMDNDVVSGGSNAASTIADPSQFKSDDFSDFPS